MVIVDHLDSVREFAQRPIWSQPASAPPLEPWFRVAEVPGAGMGLVATRAIKAGELIVSERPIYTMWMGLTFHYEQVPPRGTFFPNALSGLSAEARSTILALQNSYPPELGWDAATAILRTNLLDMDLAFEGQFRAVRDIAPDEEITVAYVELSLPWAERRAALGKKWLFNCACSTCALPPALLEQSELRRARVYELVERKLTLTTPTIPMTLLEERTRDAQTEGLYLEQAHVARIAVLMASKSGTGNKSTLEWIKKAREVFVMIESEQSKSARAMQMLDEFSRSDRVYNAK